MQFRLKRPCANCPFRVDVPPYLRPERAQEIATSIANGATFACHKTTVCDDEGEGELVAAPTSQMCAGAMVAMAKSEQANQAMRIAMRLGILDPDQLDLDAPVVGSLTGLVDHHAGEPDEDEDEVEPCSVADYGCEAPAGYMVGGSAIRNVEFDEDATSPCVSCGTAVCENCSSAAPGGGRICGYCEEPDDDD